MHIVIIGGSLNAVTAAAHLRRDNEKARITIIDKSSEIGSAACGIPSFLQGNITDINELSAASPQLLHQVFNINLMLDVDIVKINSQVHTIDLNSGKKISYDKLIFAPAPLHLRPDITGILSDNIFTLHNAAAARRANDYFWGFKAEKIIILGGGKLGIQTAAAFAYNNAKVTIIEQSSHLINYIDKEFASQIEQILTQSGLKVLTDTTVSEFHSHYAMLSDNSRLNYDMAIITTGSHNELLLPLTTNIKIGSTGGIIVNKNMETNIKDIFACGEAIELPNSVSGQPFRIRNASLAAQTAKLAADNALNNTNQINHCFNNEIISFFGYYMGVCGCCEQELQAAEINYQAIWLSTDLTENYITPANNIKMKILFDSEGFILGFQIFGKQGVFARLNTVATIMQQKGKLEDLNEIYLSYDPALGRAKDSLNILASLAIGVHSGDLKIISFNDLTKGSILLNLGPKLPADSTNSIEVINIPFTKLRNQLYSLPKNQIIALYCRNGYSSYLAYCLLRNKGFDNVFLLNSSLGW